MRELQSLPWKTSSLVESVRTHVGPKELESSHTFQMLLIRARRIPEECTMRVLISFTVGWFKIYRLTLTYKCQYRIFNLLAFQSNLEELRGLHL